MNCRPLILHSRIDEIAEDDCACPDQGLSSHTGRIRFDQESRWQHPARLYRAVLSEESELFFNPLGDAGVVVLNEPAQRIFNAYHSVNTVAEVADRLSTIALTDVMDTTRRLVALGLLHSPSPLMPKQSLEPQTLTAWLHVTNACNLRCTYCYLNKTNSAMDEIMGRAALDAVFRSAIKHGFQVVKLKYAGGEATLNFPLVIALHTYAKALATEHTLQLREVVLSNGVGLTLSMIEFIRNENIRLMISLDGIGSAHNAQRVFANGRGSFSQVSRSIERALAGGLSPHLSITVTAYNADALADAVAFALDRDLLFNLNFFRDNECAAGLGDLRAGEARLIAGMRRAFAVIEERLPRRSLIGALVDRSTFNSPHDRACGAGRTYLVIDEKGGVARCQMEIEKVVANVFVEDPLLVVREVRDGFQNIPVDQKEGCRDCEWRYWCAGGCSLLTFKMTGRSDIKSPNCNIYKSLYPEVLRLEGLRLLKWANLPAQ